MHKAVGSRFDLRAALIVVGLLLLGAVWFDSRIRFNELQHELARKLAEADTYNKESRLMATQTRDTLRDLEYKIGVLESRLSETQNQRLALEVVPRNSPAAATSASWRRWSRSCSWAASSCSSPATSRPH
jgi:Tfp pilus assembly protein PilX